MGKNRRIDHSVKLKIIDLHKSGKRNRDILRTLNAQGHCIPRHVISYWIQDYQFGYFDPYSVTLESGIKCFRKVSDRDIEIVKKSLELNPYQSSVDIHKELKRDGADFCLKTTKSAIKAAGYTNDTPRYAQMVRLPNTNPRVSFCERLIEANDSLSDIIFTDESSIQLHNNKTTTYRQIGTMNHALPKPKHPLKVHVWAGISRRGPTKILIFEGIMESKFFTEHILKGMLLPFVRQVYPDGHRFQQDNDPKHRSKLAQAFMAENGINWWDVWPSESPDLNPIEMVWSQLKRSIAKEEPRTKEELVRSITNFWYGTMTVALCNRYIDHLFKAAPVCVLMKGKATGDVPNRLLPERSEGKDFRYFQTLLHSDSKKEKVASLNQ